MDDPERHETIDLNVGPLGVEAGQWEIINDDGPTSLAAIVISLL